MTLPKMLWVPYSLRFVQRVRRFAEQVARPERLELPTLCLEGRCSIQLSYGRVCMIKGILLPFVLQFECREKPRQIASVPQRCAG